jgi:HPr kinase/phosphorylase
MVKREIMARRTLARGRGGGKTIVLPFRAFRDHTAEMGVDVRVHGSCVARDGAGVLILGPSGAGKSDLALRLLGKGFVLVADDQVDIADGLAKAPASLAGLLEVRGLGIVRLPYLSNVELRIVIALTDWSGNGQPDRLPLPERHPEFDLPLVRLHAAGASAPDRVALALDCALGGVTQRAGAFAA